jgi:hypothetical protein
MTWVVASLVVVGLGLAAFVRSTSLPRSFAARRAEAQAVPLPAVHILTEADIAGLPAPVQRYVRLTGSIGRPVTTAISMRFEAEMFDAPGAAGMTGPVVQYERFDMPRRLFLMSTRMKGLPVAVLHDFNSDRASMRVRLAGLFNVVDISGPDLTLTETVTILNDLCFLAPSRLADPALTWAAVDASRARVTYRLGPNAVSAELVFNAAGELVDFVSDDRGMLQKDGSLRILRWTTPFGDYLDFGGWRLASQGDAIWHLPEGRFTYGKIRMVSYEVK